MEDEASYFFAMLGHPLRRRIIKYLGEKGYAGFSDLKANLNVSIGTLYYQLDQLKGLLDQNESKKYALNEKGKFAYQLLLESEERISSSRYVKHKLSAALYLTRWLLGWPIILYLYGKTKYASIFAATIIIYGAYSAYKSNLYPILFIYLNHLPLSKLYIPILFVAEYLVVNAIANLIPLILYRVKEGAKPLLIGSAFSFLPSLLLPTASIFTYPTLTQAQILMLIGIGFSLCFLTSAISLSKGLAVEKAALVSSIILYLSVALTLLLVSV
ncbi:MAG: helix-turn-helix domain-containing protein [Nitrososphaerales archaeon]